MGTRYALKDVLSISQLGSSQYPRTSAGKIQKGKIAQLAQKYYDALESPAATVPAPVPTEKHSESVPAAPVPALPVSGSLEHTIRSIFAQQLRTQPEKIDVHVPISTFADSITQMRVRGLIVKQTNRHLTLAEMAGVGTVSSLVALLSSRGNDMPSVVKSINYGDGPPEIEDMVHLTNHPERYEGTRKLIERELAKHGFDWDQVEAVIPAYDAFQILSQNGVLDWWGFRYALSTKLDGEVSLFFSFQVSWTVSGQWN